MKPLKLTMTAFGSYKDKTVIDFEKLGNGLFLITGNTGSGKSTVFDAIVFALYGETSGKGRKADDMRSDFAPDKEDTFVELVFEHNGGIYHAVRSIRMKRSRDTGMYSPDDPKGTFWAEGSSDVLTKTGDIKNKVTELLGMDREQFCQIVMLAQGEFRKFLESDSKDKKEILGKLFGSLPQKYWMSILKKASDRLNGERKECEKGILHEMRETFITPRLSSDAELRGLTVPDGDSLAVSELEALTDALVGLGERDKAELDAANGRRSELDAKRGELMLAFRKAKDGNALLDRLSNAKRELDAIAAQDGDFERLAEDMNSADRAAHGVDPAKKTYTSAHDRLITDRAKRETLERKLKTDARRYEEAERRCGENEEKRSESDRLASEAAVIENSIPDYLEADRLDESRKEAEVRLNTANAELEKAAARADAKERELAELKRQQEMLEGSDLAAERAKNLSDTAEKRRKDISDTLCAAIRDFREKEKALAAEKTALLEAVENAAEKKRVFDSAYEKFLGGQKAALSAQLREAAERDGSAVCPVCGCEIHRGHTGYAKSDGGRIPSQKEVNDARRAFDAAEKLRDEAKGSYDKHTAEAEAKRGEAVSSAERLGIDPARIFEVGAETAILSEYTAEAEKLSAVYSEACVKAKKYEAIKNRIAAAEAESERLKLLRVETENRANSAKVEFTGADAEYRAKLSKLRFTTHGEARKEIEKLRAAQKKLADEISADEKAKHDAKRIVDMDAGQLEQLEANIEADIERLNEAEIGYNEAIASAGFADENEYLAAAALYDGVSPEKWLAGVRKKIDDHRKGRDRAESAYNELCKSAEGIERADMASLEKSVNEMNGEYAEADANVTRLNSECVNHRQVLDYVRGKGAVLAKLAPLSSKLEELSRLANGSSDGRITFDTYALQAVFEEILAMANERIDVASRGRYSLLLNDSGKGGGKKGLDIDVMDELTGQKRGVNSLSGGEGFIVSLSLALGLSDVVRNHAGATRIDSMFIDEGFGTLDGDAIDKAIEVLNMLSVDGAQVGIISHVEKLEACIPAKIKVTGGSNGSTAEVVIG